MSSLHLPKSVVSMPSFHDERGDKDTTDTIRAARFNEIVTTITEQSVEDVHENRLTNLRKQLEYLKETEWKYVPADKYIGQ